MNLEKYLEGEKPHVVLLPPDTIPLEFSVKYSKNIPKPLLKYGLTVLLQFSFAELEKNDYYLDGLNFVIPPLKSEILSEDINSLAEIFGKNFNNSSIELWEICYLFLNVNEIKKIYANQPENLKPILLKHHLEKKVLVKNKWGETYDVFIYQLEENRTEYDLCLFFLQNIRKFLENQKKGSSMILQLSTISLELTVHLLDILTHFYESTYVYKPMITSPIAESQYLVLINLLDEKYTEKLKSLRMHGSEFVCALIRKIPEQFSHRLQIFLSFGLSRKFRFYHHVKLYLQENNFTGYQRHAMIQQQKKNMEDWIDYFVGENDGKLDRLIKDSFLLG